MTTRRAGPAATRRAGRVPFVTLIALAALGVAAAGDAVRASAQAVGLEPEPAPERSAATAATAATATTDTTEGEALIAAGLEVYLGQYCGVCHALKAAQTGGPFGPPHDGMGILAAERIADPEYSGGATTAEEYLRESILEPTRYIVPGYGARYQMPAYTSLSDEELHALVHMLLEQR